MMCAKPAWGVSERGDRVFVVCPFGRWSAGRWFFFDVTDRRELLPSDGTRPVDEAQKHRAPAARSFVTEAVAHCVAASGHRPVCQRRLRFSFERCARWSVVRLGDAADPALGYEIGARTRLSDRLDLALALWGLIFAVSWSGLATKEQPKPAERRAGLTGVRDAAAHLGIFCTSISTSLPTTRAFARPRNVATPSCWSARDAVERAFIADEVWSARIAALYRHHQRPATEDEFLIAQGAYLFDAFWGIAFALSKRASASKTCSISATNRRSLPSLRGCPASRPKAPHRHPSACPAAREPRAAATATSSAVRMSALRPAIR